MEHHVLKGLVYLVDPTLYKLGCLLPGCLDFNFLGFLLSIFILRKLLGWVQKTAKQRCQICSVLRASTLDSTPRAMSTGAKIMFYVDEININTYTWTLKYVEL